MISKAAKGFTLIELLVVLMIMSVLLVATPIAFDRVLPGMELRADAREVARLFREARSRAIRENLDSGVLVNVAARAIRLEERSPEWVISDGVEVTLRAAASEWVDEDSARIRFFPDGTSTGGRVSLTRSDTKYHVEVDWLSGRVRIVE